MREIRRFISRAFTTTGVNHALISINNSLSKTNNMRTNIDATLTRLQVTNTIILSHHLVPSQEVSQAALKTTTISSSITRSASCRGGTTMSDL